MFYRVVCVEEDIDVFQFLWWSEGIDKLLSDYKIMVYLFGKVNFLRMIVWVLRRIVIDSRIEFSKDVCKIVFKNFYVDDCLFLVLIIELVIKLLLQLIQLLRKGNFYLIKFVFNVKEVLVVILVEERIIKNLDLDKFFIKRVLGLQWDIEMDIFGVKLLLLLK